MKKLLLLIITILCLTGCSAEEKHSTQLAAGNISTTTTSNIAAKEISNVSQKGEVDGEKYVIITFEASGIDGYYREGKQDLFPREKRKLVYEKAGIDEYTISLESTNDNNEPNYFMKSILDMKPTSKIEGLSKGDIVTYEVSIKEGVNITLEQVEEILGVTFEPSEYIVK